MKVNKINSTLMFRENNHNKFTDKVYTNIRNASDMNDTVAVPRTIFKGYVGFIAGTALTALAPLLKKWKGAQIPVNIAGVLAIIYGAYSFARPYMFKGVNGVTSK